MLPTYNGEEHIRKSIDSILEQTYTNWELIVVNDCSTDGTAKIVEEYTLKDNRIRLVNNSTNQRLPRALNIGFEKATGDYYTWTSDDNAYHKNALEIMIGELELHSDIDLVYSDFNRIDLENGEILGVEEKKSPKELCFVNTVGACFLYRKKLAAKIGKYDPNFFLAEDYEYWIRAYLNGKLMHIDKILYDYGMHGQSLTSTRQKDIGKATYDVKNKYFTDLLNKCENQEEVNRFFDEMLRLLSDKKEMKKVRNQYYKIDNEYRKSDIKKRIVKIKNIIIWKAKRVFARNKR